MNAQIRRLMTLVVVVLTFCLFSLEQTTSAVSNSGTVTDKHCRKVKGKFSDVVGGGSNTGTITNGGILNGTTERVFNSGALPTPDPTTVSFTGDYIVTTNRGVLKAHDVYLFDFARGVGTAIHRIDPEASTGIFAGATGVFFDNAKATASTAEGVLTGEICLAHDDVEDENEDDGANR